MLEGFRLYQIWDFCEQLHVCYCVCHLKRLHDNYFDVFRWLDSQWRLTAWRDLGNDPENRLYLSIQRWIVIHLYRWIQIAQTATFCGCDNGLLASKLIHKTSPQMRCYSQSNILRAVRINDGSWRDTGAGLGCVSTRPVLTAYLTASSRACRAVATLWNVLTVCKASNSVHVNFLTP